MFEIDGQYENIKDYIPNVVNAIMLTLRRYDQKLNDMGIALQKNENDGTELNHIRWMIRHMQTVPLSFDKLNRWFGFIQGVLITKGLYTVQSERDYFRELLSSSNNPSAIDSL